MTDHTSSTPSVPYHRAAGKGGKTAAGNDFYLYRIFVVKALLLCLFTPHHSGGYQLPG